MKKVLFYLFKILEVAAWFLWLWLFSLFADWIHMFDWMDKFPITAGITAFMSFIVLILLTRELIVSGFFTEWIKLNKKWVNQILGKD